MCGKSAVPPDPDGLFKTAAARAKKVIAMYDDLNAGLGQDFLISNLVFDLICLSDRDPKLGDVDEECVFALQTYEKFVTEHEYTVGTLSYDEAFGRKEPVR